MAVRECGECFACCKWLGINELNKPPVVACKHLNGANGPSKRCSIYHKRPVACQQYLCGWLGGLLGDDMRPDQCGLLVTVYADTDSGVNEDGMPAKLLVTVNVIDAAKAGTVDKGHLGTAIHNLLASQAALVTRVTVVNHLTGQVTEFSGGEVWGGRLVKTKNVEELIFSRDRLLGKYLSAESVEDLPMELRSRTGAIVLSS